MRVFVNPSTLRTVALTLLAFSVMGCGAGSVTGKVKLNGVPLNGGWVTLNYTNGKHDPVSGSIHPDGTYRVAGCPCGEARVTVRVATRSLPKIKTSGPKASSVLRRYADAEKTDLVCNVTSGSQDFDIDLKP